MTTDSVIDKKKQVLKNVKEPPKYKVVIYNDDFTPMEFVIDLLISVFNHDQSHAVELTLLIHNQGNAIAGVYSYEIAEQKGVDATDLSRNCGYPLMIKLEQA